MTGVRVALLGAGLAAAGCGSFVAGRGEYEQTYYPARHNWIFRRAYPEADRLFNAFDFGHATLYESLLRHDRGETIDGPVFSRTTNVLHDPPNIPLEERAIAPEYATLIPEVVAMFDWAHMLHRQLYDVLSDARIAPAARELRAAEVLAYYRSRPDLALASHPKSMALMESQPYSLTFRHRAPRYNALIWSYHWLQMVVYEALLASDSAASRHDDVHAAVGHFWAMIDGSAAAPTVMPMSAAISPAFAERYSDAAIVFDNLHALHDVISDILASNEMPAPAKRRAALLAASRYRDSTTSVTSRAEWAEMSRAMGVANMGGGLSRSPNR
jgi:hypothetical protein